MPLIRRHDWQNALDLFLQQHQTDRFQYGRWDCCLFVCDAVEVMTGVDIAARFRNGYRTRREALGAIREYTGKGSVLSVAQRVTSDFHMEKVPITMAQRGDVALFDRSRGDHSLGIVALNGTDVIALSVKGMLRFPLSHAISAWRV